MRTIIIIMLVAVLGLSGCHHNPPKVCSVPPELKLIPQGELTLDHPRAMILTIEGRKYVAFTPEDWEKIIRNNALIAEYIREAKQRYIQTKDYYEQGISHLRVYEAED
jgi:hypothetical protein